jgi:hypothetical protein
MALSILVTMQLLPILGQTIRELIGSTNAHFAYYLRKAHGYNHTTN